MEVFKTHLALNKFVHQHSPASTGLVPTMGALHPGHLALVQRACKENDLAIVSIFVNPTQFDDASDLANYPKTLEEDLEKLTSVQDNLIVYAPEVHDLYPANEVRKTYSFGALETHMEGRSRTGHFQGVATVVHKFFELFRPTRAYFGEKDFQQLQVIRSLVEQEKLEVTIVNCPIVREKDGLAMSSRNRRLSNQQRMHAPLIFEKLTQAKRDKQHLSPGEITKNIAAYFDAHQAFELDYFCLAEAQTLYPITQFSSSQETRAFIAVKMGDVRLIDNINF